MTLPLSRQQSQNPGDSAHLPLCLACSSAPSTTPCLLQSLDTPHRLPTGKHQDLAAICWASPSQNRTVSCLSHPRTSQPLPLPELIPCTLLIRNVPAPETSPEPGRRTQGHHETHKHSSCPQDHQPSISGIQASCTAPAHLLLLSPNLWEAPRLCQFPRPVPAMGSWAAPSLLFPGSW